MYDCKDGGELHSCESRSDFDQGGGPYGSEGLLCNANSIVDERVPARAGGCMAEGNEESGRHFDSTSFLSMAQRAGCDTQAGSECSCSQRWLPHQKHGGLSSDDSR